MPAQALPPKLIEVINKKYNCWIPLDSLILLVSLVWLKYLIYSLILETNLQDPNQYFENYISSLFKFTTRLGWEPAQCLHWGSELPEVGSLVRAILAEGERTPDLV